jgi:hypothetical protein
MKRCKDEPLATFFPEPIDGQVLQAKQYARARALCTLCDVRRQCAADVLEWERRALTSDTVPQGFVGGMSPRDRRVVLGR